MTNDVHKQIIDVIAKLDNGSHSANQLQGVDEKLFEIFKKYSSSEKLITKRLLFVSIIVNVFCVFFIAVLPARADALPPELTADFPAIAELSFPLGVEYQDVSSTLNYVAEVPHEDWSGIVAVVYNQSYYRFGQPLKGYVVTPCKYKAYLIEYGDCTAQKLIVYRFNNGILPPKY